VSFFAFLLIIKEKKDILLFTKSINRKCQKYWTIYVFQPYKKALPYSWQDFAKQWQSFERPVV